MARKGKGKSKALDFKLAFLEVPSRVELLYTVLQTVT
jgi:hypothetical protein